MKKFFSVQRISLMAMFVALQIVLARYLAIQASSTVRISLENIPTILAAAWMGPISGAVVGAVADILGMLLQSSSGVYFPPLTLTPILLALIVGYSFRFFSTKRQWPSLAVSIAIGECIANLLYMTLALTWYNKYILQTEIPYTVLFAGRLPVKSIVMAIDILLCCLLHRMVYKKVVQKVIAYEL